MLRAAWWVFYTESVLLLRRSQEWLYSLGFFVIVMCFFPLAFTTDPETLQKLIPGCIWITALLASLLATENVFYSDMEDGNLEQLLLCQLPLAWLIAAKLFAQWIISELPLILLTPVLCLLFHLPVSAILFLCLGLLLGTPILTLIGSLGVALTLGLRQQGVLLAILILPLVTPVLIFGVNIVKQAEAGFAVAGACAFLAGLCVLAITLLPWVIAVALRVSLDD